MYRRLLFMITILFAASAATSQEVNGTFWSTPGTTLRDVKGNITYTEIKDPASFTMKVFDHGTWFRYQYAPNSAKLVRVEAPDLIEDYLYTGNEWNGLTVHGRSGAHTLHVTDGLVAAEGMPPITIVRDAQNRDTAVKRGNQVVATISYDANNQVRALTIGDMTLNLSIEPNGIREVLATRTAVLITTVAQTRTKRQFPVSLDPVADRLGLAADWRNTVHVRRSGTGSLITVADGHSQPIAEMVQLGAMAAAFDAKGAPLFYDLRLNYTATPHSSGDATPDPTTALNSVLPNRLIVPITGDASGYVQTPGDGAISSLWTATDGPAPSYRFVIYHEKSTTHSSNLFTPRTTSTPQLVTTETRAKRKAISPLMLWQCGSEEHWSCTSSGGSGSCYNYYTPVYCDSGGGGGYNPPPDDSGGGTGTGNQVSNDPALRVAVNSALNSATNKFQTTRCSQDLFKDTKLADGTSLFDVLTQHGTDANTWLTSSLTYINGYTNGTCADHPAWTTVNGQTVTVCTSFKNMGASQGAVVLIHEELHTLGLTERPGYPDAAMDPAQITQLVMNYCGG